MRKILNVAVFGFAVLGCSLVCHMIGTVGHNKGIDPLIIASIILPVSGLGIAGLISKFAEE